jgi:hypothetical protein
MTKVVAAMSVSLDGIAGPEAADEDGMALFGRSWAGSSRCGAGARSRARRARRTRWTPGCGRRTSTDSVLRSSGGGCSTSGTRTEGGVLQAHPWPTARDKAF